MNERPDQSTLLQLSGSFSLAAHLNLKPAASVQHRQNKSFFFFSSASKARCYIYIYLYIYFFFNENKIDNAMHLFDVTYTIYK